MVRSERLERAFDLSLNWLLGMAHPDDVWKFPFPA